jgi:hypothetical protein
MKLFVTILIFVVALSFAMSQTITKKVLLEEFSTAPCGFCPEGGIIAERLIHQYPDVFTFTHHAGFGTDSMTINESRTIAAQYTNFAPAAVIDRGDYKAPPYTNEGYLGISRQKWDSIVAVRLNDPAQVEVKISELDVFGDRLLKVTIDVVFNEEMVENDYRYNIAIIEDSVSGIGKGWDQKNYFNGDAKYPTLYQKGDPIVGYIHRHVLRAMPTGAWGMTNNMPRLPQVGVTKKYQMFGYKIPERWKIKDLKIIAFVSAYNDSVYKHKIFNSDEKSFDEVVNVDDENISNKDEFIIRPNPIEDLAYIDCNIGDINSAKFELYSSNGTKIRDIKDGLISQQTNVYFYTSDLSAGLYFIKINLQDRMIIRSFVKI